MMGYVDANGRTGIGMAETRPLIPNNNINASSGVNHLGVNQNCTHRQMSETGESN